MAVPKRRQSHSRKNKRRANYKLNIPAQSVCPECGEIKQPHRVCSNCGSYKGKTVVNIDAD